VETRLDQTDLSPKPEKFEGRKAKSDRAILVELFTGAQCPTCVGAGLALDGLLKTYKSNEVIVLSYHLHGNGPDPMTNQDTFDRAEAYGEVVEATPTVVLNGRPLSRFGGTIDEAADLYKGIRKLIDPRLDETPKATLKVSATQKGTKVNIAAEVSDLVRTGEGVRLKLALVEPVVRYVGGNKVRVHHQVVRAMPAGVKGVAMTDKAAKKEVSVDLEELRGKWNKYLDDFAKKAEVKFPSPERPMDFRNLKGGCVHSGRAEPRSAPGAQADAQRVTVLSSRLRLRGPREAASASTLAFPIPAILRNTNLAVRGVRNRPPMVRRPAGGVCSLGGAVMGPVEDRSALPWNASAATCVCSRACSSTSICAASSIRPTWCRSRCRRPQEADQFRGETR
jgi:hypothetical protein